MSKFETPLRKRILNRFAYGKPMTTNDLIEFTIKETKDEIRNMVKELKQDDRSEIKVWLRSKEHTTGWNDGLKKLFKEIGEKV